MESHPEENNYGKHKQQSYDTLFSLFRSQLLFYHVGRLSLFRVIVRMFECRTESYINKHWNNQGHTCHTKSIVVSFGELIDISSTESGNVTGKVLCSLQGFQSSLVGRSDCSIEILMCQWRNLRDIRQTCLAQHIIGYFRCGCRSIHCANIDSHIENTECSVAFGTIFGGIIQITHHHL